MRLAEAVSQNVECSVVSIWKYDTLQEKDIVSSLEGKMKFFFLLDATRQKKMNIFILFSQVKKLYSEIKPQIIHSHSAGPDILSFLLKLRFPRTLKVIRTMHTNIKWARSSILERLFVDHLFPFFYDEEISISSATKKRLDGRFAAKVGHKKSRYIPNGLNDDVFVMGSRKPFPRKFAPPFQAISVGRLAPQKGYEFLLRSIHHIYSNPMTESLGIRLVILGDGELREPLEKLSEDLGISTYVNFTGYREDALALISSSDLFISSSIWEGLPTVVLEAMALKVPVVATRIPGTDELIHNRETGLLAQPKNPVALADAIVEMLSDNKLRFKIAENAYTKAQEFSMKRIKSTYLEVYKQIAPK